MIAWVVNLAEIGEEFVFFYYIVEKLKAGFGTVDRLGTP